jgi:hypothetical protein
MRDTPWHARPRAPEPPSATQPAPQQTTFRRLVIVNQELAQHNAKVRPVSFPPDARGELPRHDPTGPDRTLLSYPQLRQDLADARRRATVAANAEAQAGIVVAMHREKQAEAARLRRELLVRDERKTRAFRPLSKHIWERAGSLLAVEKKWFRFSDVVSNPFLSPRRPAWARRARRSAGSGSRWTRRPVCCGSSARSVCRPRTDRRGKTRTLRPPRRRLREGLFAKVFRNKTPPHRPRPSRGRRSAASRTRSFYTFLLRWKTPRRTPCRASHRQMPSRRCPRRRPRARA